jgi:hypothetical protein
MHHLRILRYIQIHMIHHSMLINLQLKFWFRFFIQMQYINDQTLPQQLQMPNMNHMLINHVFHELIHIQANFHGHQNFQVNQQEVLFLSMVIDIILEHLKMFQIMSWYFLMWIDPIYHYDRPRDYYLIFFKNKKNKHN